MARPKKASLYRVDGIFYVSYWRDEKRVRESTGTNLRKIAEEIRLQREREMITGTVEIQQKFTSALAIPGVREQIMSALEPKPTVTLEAAKDAYLVQCKTYKRAKTIATDRGRLKSFLGAILVKDVNHVKTSDINEYIAAKVARDGTSPTTVLRIREVLHAFFEFCRKQGHVEKNPVDGVPRPRIAEQDIRFLNFDQIARCLEAVESDLIEALIATAIYAGLRREELCWLRWEDVNLEHRLLRIRGKSDGEVSWVPKTKKNRTVPISSDLLPFLARLPLPHVGWVFKSFEGCRWDPDNLGHRFAELMKKAGLPWNFLDLRHTFGSTLAQKGVSLHKVSELLGNSPEIARRHYARLTPESMRFDVEFRRGNNAARASGGRRRAAEGVHGRRR